VDTAADAPVLPAGSLAGKRALITGSSRGIGADTAKYLAAAGARVAINYRNKEVRALKLVAEITDAGGEAIAIGGDLTDPASVTAMFQTVTDAFGGLDILVLNASGGMEGGMAEDYAMQLNRDAQVSVLETALPERVAVKATELVASPLRLTPPAPLMLLAPPSAVEVPDKKEARPSMRVSVDVASPPRPASPLSLRPPTPPVALCDRMSCPDVWPLTALVSAMDAPLPPSAPAKPAPPEPPNAPAVTFMPGSLGPGAPTAVALAATVAVPPSPPRFPIPEACPPDPPVA
jgi:hypothetical protein